MLGACAPALETRFTSSEVFSGLGQGRKGGSVRAMVNTPHQMQGFARSGILGVVPLGLCAPSDGGHTGLISPCHRTKPSDKFMKSKLFAIHVLLAKHELTGTRPPAQESVRGNGGQEDLVNNLKRVR